MLSDINELNDELIEQINGGLEDNGYDKALAEVLFICPNCGKRNDAYKKRADGFCPNCEPQTLKTGVTIDDIKTTVPDLSNKDKLFKLD